MTKWRREKTQINKIKDEQGTQPQILIKSRGSLESMLKTFVQENRKIYMKWINF
jgi:hypothetical protein